MNWFECVLGLLHHRSKSGFAHNADPMGEVVFVPLHNLDCIKTLDQGSKPERDFLKCLWYRTYNISYRWTNTQILLWSLNLRYLGRNWLRMLLTRHISLRLRSFPHRFPKFWQVCFWALSNVHRWTRQQLSQVRTVCYRSGRLNSRGLLTESSNIPKTSYAIWTTVWGR